MEASYKDNHATLKTIKDNGGGEVYIKLADYKFREEGIKISNCEFSFCDIFP